MASGSGGGGGGGGGGSGGAPSFRVSAAPAVGGSLRNMKRAREEEGEGEGAAVERLLLPPALQGRSVSRGGPLPSAPLPTAPLPRRPNAFAIQVSERQRDNPLLRHVVNVPWEFNAALVPDFELGAQTCE
jgi:hypothetical protein